MKKPLIYALLFIYLISIILFPFNFNLTKYECGVVEEKKTISIRTSSSNPPNKLYFKYFKTITILEEKVSGSGSYTNFPVIISILDSDLHDDVQANGNDIAFANATDWLDHEIEYFNQTYNETHAKLIAWVRIPSLSTSINTTIYMYYGNSTMSSRQNPTGVWDSSYKGVWHLSELNGSAIDSTSHSTSGSVSGTVSRGAVGMCDGAYDFGNNGQIDFGDPGNGHLDMGTGSFTISFWINIDQSISWYQLPLYKGATDQYDVGYDFETNTDATVLSFRICDNSENLGESPFLSVTFDSWMYVTGIVDRTLNRIRIFKNGLQVGSGGNIAGIGNINNNNHFYASAAVGNCEIDGLMDEIRICNVQRSAGWIQTEYNNQNDPQSFLSVSLEESIDNTPPIYSNLIESSDPLELGETEVITINVSDPSGINQVKIEFTSTNHSMTNIGGDMWQYNLLSPNSVGNYSYTIWMEDNYHNWNFTMGIIEVIDIAPPTYSNLIESADPLQLGQNETIEIKVFDLSGVNQTLLEYDSSNHSMAFQGGNKWSWNNWRPTIGVHPYKIYMQDNQNNWNTTSGNINVITIYAPFIENLTESEDPLELGNDIIINADVYDNETWVSTVLIELDGINRTMSNISGNSYEYIWNSSEYIESGYSVGLPLIINFKIYTNDTDNNWNSLSSSFDIVDTIGPVFSALFESDDPLELGNTVIITVNSTDLSNIYQVKIYFEGSNHSMTYMSGDMWQYNSWRPESTGNYTYIIWSKDNNNNWDFICDSILIRDTTPPTYSNLTESANPVELGTSLIISVKATDLANIKEVLIEYENSNQSMAYAGDDIWDFDSWFPNSIGNCTYKIYIKDNNDNLNYLTSWILFFDSIIPDCDHLFEAADPLELGNNEIIRINAYDFAGINQCLLEYEGMNHSMTNIYGNTWQFDSWIPNNWTYYQYKIYIEDKSGNWNFIVDNMTVQDTTPPSPPILTNGPSGSVTGVLVFDWQDGSDPSGITHYILIIDNETDLSITPGFIYKVNLTNSGVGSSYYELTEVLPSGKYYYFLTQIDGAGHQSGYTVGSFTISINNNNNFMLYIIIAIAIVSVLGSISAIVIIKKKSQKKLKTYWKKIPLKLILSHINKISSSTPSSYEVETQNLIVQKPKTQDTFKEGISFDKEQKLDIEELKNLGENLFEEGAYLEAIKQFEYAKELLIKQRREEEITLFSELIDGIKGLIKERETRIEALDSEKTNGNSIKVFELYQDIIEISKKLRDLDGINMFKSELIDFFKANKLRILEINQYRSSIEQRAELFYKNNYFELAAQEFEKCEKISELLANFRKEEIINVEQFESKKINCLNKRNV
jgi:hypothetical protein